MTEQPEGEGASRGQDGVRKAPKRITAPFLQRTAMHYLERYAAPSVQLRRVLLRKIERSCRHHELDPAEFSGMLDEVVANCLRIGLVDDERFAAARAATLRRKGRSARAVSAGLAAKGVPREIAAAVIASGEEDGEQQAARIAARRKRIGPWSRIDRKENRQKHLAVLLRAGFPLAIARAVIDGEGEDMISPP